MIGSTALYDGAVVAASRLAGLSCLRRASLVAFALALTALVVPLAIMVCHALSASSLLSHLCFYGVALSLSC
jgi:hypothetical protein